MTVTRPETSPVYMAATGIDSVLTLFKSMLIDRVESSIGVCLRRFMGLTADTIYKTDYNR